MPSDENERPSASGISITDLDKQSTVVRNAAMNMVPEIVAKHFGDYLMCEQCKLYHKPEVQHLPIEHVHNAQKFDCYRYSLKLYFKSLDSMVNYYNFFENRQDLQ